MSMRKVLNAITAVLLIVGSASLSSDAIAQTAGTSVLPTGGGQALLDPSDTALLLLDHQTGLFQTVKDISITELRTNTITLDLEVASGHHTVGARLSAQRHENQQPK